MKAEFSQILSMLRHEKGISQRRAAADLKISQALLSHYENSAREPGLDFVKRACAYYGVSSDFLLGLEPMRSGNPGSGQEDQPMRTLASQASRVIHSVETIFQLLSAIENDRAMDEASRYMGAAIYKLYRYILQFSPSMEPGELEVPQEQFGPLCDVEMRLAEMELCTAFQNSEAKGLDFKKDLPLISGLLEELLGSMDKTIAGQYCKEKP